MNWPMYQRGASVVNIGDKKLECFVKSRSKQSIKIKTASWLVVQV